MAGRPQVITRKSNGAPVNPSTDIVSRCAVIAPSYAGTLQTKQYSRRKQVYDQYTEGPLVRAAVHCIEETTIPIVTQRCDATNVGTYDTIDISGFTGTAVPVVKSGTTPRNEYELYFVCVEGGTIGTAGITYRLSTAAGRGIDSKDLLRLGTATSVTFGNSGCAFDFDPPVAELIALANELKTDYNAHRVLTSGGVHGAADSTNAVSSADATDIATAITLLNEIRTDYAAHRVLTSGTVHGAADSTNVVTAAVATDGQTALTLALDLKAKYNAHRVLTSGGVHGAADSTNVVSSTASRGTVVAGDIIQCKTFAPYPSANELAAAFVTLSEGDKLPGLILLPWRVTPSYGPTITEGLGLLRDNGLPCQCIVQARAFDVGTDGDLETYRDNLETEWAAVEDDRITVVATDLLFILADGTATISVPEQRLAGGAISFAARVINTPLGRTTWAPVDGSIEGGSLVDNEGVLIGWNEPIGNDGARLQVFYRVPDAQQGRPTVPSVDNCLTDPDTGIKTLRGGRIWDQIDRIVRSFAWDTVGLTADVTINPNNATQGVLSEEKRQDLIRRCAARLESDPVLQSCITNLSDPNLVTLESDVTVNGEVVYLEFNTNAMASLGIGKITFTHNVRTGGN